jgi:Skp family chaperone for outer membrane proteins
MRQRLLFSTAALFLFFALTSISQADRYIRVASIDFGYIFKKYSGTKRVRSKLDKIRKSLSVKIKQRKQEINRLEYFYNLNKSGYTEFENRWYLAEIKIKKAKLNEEISTVEKKLKILERRLSRPLVTEIYLAAQKISRRYGFSIVLDSKYVVVADARHNLSEFVLVYLERKIRGHERE